MRLKRQNQTTEQEALFNCELALLWNKGQKKKKIFFFWIPQPLRNYYLLTFDRFQTILNSPKRLLKILSTYIGKENFPLNSSLRKNCFKEFSGKYITV